MILITLLRKIAIASVFVNDPLIKVDLASIIKQDKTATKTSKKKSSEVLALILNKLTIFKGLSLLLLKSQINNFQDQ